MGKKIVVALSGGVDSAVAAHLLADAGWEVLGCFMSRGSPGEKTGGNDGESGLGTGPAGLSGHARDARRIAERLGIRFCTVDFREAFRQLVQHFCSEYNRGRTPNPCILCNRRLKFGKLLELAEGMGAEGVATGHYVRLETRDDRRCLRRALDRGKDQSYFLCRLTQDQLERIHFPLGELTKPCVREIAKRLGLPVIRKGESQEICFIPGGDYRRLLRETTPEAFRPGTVIDTSGRQIGTHTGYQNFTIGQRRGLRIALGRRAYVVAIDPVGNRVILGEEADLLRPGLTAADVNWISRPPLQEGEEIRASVQIRHRHRAAPATLSGERGGKVRVRFDRSQRAVAPGQAAVFYRDDLLLGGGWIESDPALIEALLRADGVG
jgi:tRNA-specific 2-thiouridylase